MEKNAKLTIIFECTCILFLIVKALNDEASSSSFFVVFVIVIVVVLIRRASILNIREKKFDLE